MTDNTMKLISPSLEVFVFWYYSLAVEGITDPISVAEGTKPQFNLTHDQARELVSIFAPIRQQVELALYELIKYPRDIEHYVANEFTFMTATMLNEAKSYLKEKCGIHLSIGFSRPIPEEKKPKMSKTGNDLKVKVLMIAAVEASTCAEANERLADQREGKFNPPYGDTYRDAADLHRIRARKLIWRAAELADFSHEDMALLHGDDRDSNQL
jgi:hypothetical protein